MLYHILLLIHVALAVVPNIPKISSQLLPNPHYSLPNLLSIESKEDINNFDISNNIQFDNGRLLLGELGSIWGKYKIPTLNKPWTIELIFRSTGTQEDRKYEDNSLNVWLLNEDNNNLPFDSFDGFETSINNEGQIPGVKLYNNDGLQNIIHDASHALGTCKFQYLDSDVPFTLRISYDANSWFKIQMDNNLCFRTNQISIPFQELKLGITSKINQQSNEKFEILSLKTWELLTADAIDDHGLMIGDEIKIDVETEVKNDNQVKPNHIRESLMERAQRLRKEAIDSERQNLKNQDSNTNSQLDLILSKLNYLEVSLTGLNGGEDDSQILSINKEITGLNNVFAELKSTVTDTKQAVVDLQNVLVKQYSQMLDSIAQLNQKVIGEVREQHYGMEELSRKVDLLMNNHKEIAYQYEKTRQDTQGEASKLGNVIDKLLKWILFPLVLILLVLVIFVYRLRHDIKHSKLL